MKHIKRISVEVMEGGSREVTVVGVFDRAETLEESDVASLMNAIEEANGAVGSGEAKTEEKPKRRRRKAAETEAEAEEEPEAEEEEAEPKKPRRRRAKAEEPEEEAEEEEEKPKRRRRSKKAEEPEEEVEEEEKPKRRRRSKKTEEPEEETGPTKADVAKAASTAAVELGPKLAGEIIGEYSTTGKLEDIPVGDRQDFIDDINNELEAED